MAGYNLEVAGGEPQEKLTDWTTRTGKTASPKLTFEAYEAGLNAAIDSLSADPDLVECSGAHTTLLREAKQLLRNGGIATLKQADDALELRLSCLGVGEGYPLGKPRRNMIAAFREGLNQAMQVTASLPNLADR